jgi:glutamine synthetase adenylyltransferase
MEAMARDWTDDRLDALSERVVLGFKHVDERFEQIDQRFEKIDADIRELRGEMAEMRRTMSQGFIGLAGVMLTGFVGLFTLIVIAQL